MGLSGHRLNRQLTIDSQNNSMAEGGGQEGSSSYYSPIISPEGLTPDQLMEIADDINVFTQFYDQMKAESNVEGKKIPSQHREIAGTSRGTPSLRRSVGMSSLLRSPSNAIGSGMSPGDFLQFNEEREEAKLKQYYQVLFVMDC